MEVLINELSLDGQYASIEDFLANGLNEMLPLLNGFTADITISKSYNFYKCNVTNEITIHSILVGNYSRTIDEIRKYKLLLSNFFENPYWEDDQKHSLDVDYQYNQNNVTGTSLAESCEREQTILSFNNGGYNDKSIVITSSNDCISIINLVTLKDLQDLLFEDVNILSDVNRFQRTNLIRQGKAVFQEINTGFFWYLDNFHRNHFEVFNSNRDHLGTANLDGIMISNAINGRKL